MLIDNFLYSTRVPHAYAELELHLAEGKVMTPDFCCLTAKGNVYIEFGDSRGNRITIRHRLQEKTLQRVRARSHRRVSGEPR